MKIFCADDDELHLKYAVRCVKAALAQIGSNAEVVGFNNGQELLDATLKEKPLLVTLDINMPVMDGLSALARLRVFHKTLPILMASSENERIIKRLSADDHSAVDLEKKQALLAKVIQRVALGTPEPGKINSILQAVSELGMDPIATARQIGANEFLSKPYDLEIAAKLIAKYL